MKEILIFLVMVNFGFQMLFFGGLIVLVSIIAVGAYTQSVWKKRKKLRAAFAEKKQEYLEKKKLYDDKVKNAFYGFRTLPVWAVAKCQYATSPLQSYRKGFTPDDDFFTAFEATNDVTYMKFALGEISHYLVVFSRVLLDFEAIEIEIKQVEDAIVQSMSDFVQKLADFNQDLLSYDEQEYDLASYHAQYALLTTEFQQLEIEKSSKTVADRDIEFSIKDLHERLDEAMKSIYRYIQSKTW